MASSKSKCTLIIDGNWLLMSRLSVLNNRYKDEKELCKELKLLMVKSINLVLPSVLSFLIAENNHAWINIDDKVSFLIG